MYFTMCHIEVFDEETNRWEYVPESSDPEEITIWYNNLDFFFNAFNLFFLFTAIENEGQLTLFNNYKGLPKDCSQPIANAHHFYFEEVPVGKHISFLTLSELFTFNYDQIINLNILVKKSAFKLIYPEIYKKKKQFISHKEWLGEKFFIELQKTKHRFDKYPDSRCIYFLYEVDLQ